MRKHAEKKGDDSCHHDHEHHEHGEKSNKWSALAHAFIMDWMMMWKELLGGFLIAGFIATLVPHSWWQALFLQSGPGGLRLLENALVGPLIAIASFVCSVGNIPLASHLWSNGISFGGVISFIYADLLVIPLILIYAKYYGARAAGYITVIFYLTSVSAGLIVDLIFRVFGLIPSGPRPPSAVEHAMIQWNYTSWLDIAAAVVFVLMLFLRTRRSSAQQHACH